MSEAPQLSVLDVQCFEWPFALRLPFRFGVITVTEGRQAVVRVRVALDGGREAWGTAAESLAAKWFDKDPRWSDAQNLDQLRRALEIAAAYYRAAGAKTAFAHFADSYAPQLESCGKEGLNPLVASFGPALLDRAVLDALCRSLGVPFYDAIQRNLPGIGAHPALPDLTQGELERMLPSLKPAQSIALRHTVGLVDPIRAADAAPADRVNDSLPQTLEEVVRFYRPRYFKLKVAGNLEADLDRLTAIAAVLDAEAGDYRATLDGNEQYGDAEAVLALWRAMTARPALAKLCAAILFIEQPIARGAALARELGALRDARPVIIDESDGTLDAFPRAKALGYKGVSSKACKGLYKSLVNLARCRQWNAALGRSDYFMSAEDLTTLAGPSVQQDLALANLLGIAHIERNGHHYIDGFAGRPAAEAEAFLEAHPGLYHRQGRRVRLKIAEGRIDIRSLAGPGFALNAEPDTAAMEPMPPSRWKSPAP